MAWSLALYPDDAKRRPGGVRCEVWRSIPGKGSTYCIHTRGPRLPRPFTIHSGLEGERNFRLVVELL